MKEYIKQPIPEIHAAYRALSAAVDAHLSGDFPAAKVHFEAANDPKVWRWLDDAWIGVRKHIVHKEPPADTREIPAADRDPDRAISPAVRAEVLMRDGYCGLPVIDAGIRKNAHTLYPTAVPWNSRVSKEQHAGFQVFWLQFDHVEPHSHGGRSTAENVVVSCAACNFGKDKHTLRQLDLIDPRDRPPVPSDFDGLERFHSVGNPRKLKSAENRLPDRKCLAALAAFAPKFREPGVTFGGWAEPQGSGLEGDFIHPGYFKGNALFDEFHSAMYKWGWVSDEFDYHEWMNTHAAEKLRSDPRTIGKATADDLLKLVTVLMRGEYWSDGSLAKTLERGILLAAAERAESILQNGELVSGSLGHYSMP
jgi:hypothetical protein